MKTLNQDTKAVFCQLLEKMQGSQHLKIENDPFQPLVLENIGQIGEAVLFSLCHYYKLNGDLMQDPEMCFAVIGRDAENLQVVPYMYNQADMGIYQESIRFEDGQLYCDEELQAEHAEFAQVWLNNILAQGYLK